MKYFVEQGVDAAQKDKILQTPLYYTCREGKYHCSKFLLDNGCPINHTDMYSQTPIYYAARENKLNVLQLLVERGADANVEDKYGQTCIFYAIKEGHFEIVEYLVQNGADLNKVDKKKLTPYAFALKHNKIRIADLLISNGAVVNTNKQAAKKVKPTKTEEDVKMAEIEDNQPNKYILVRVLDNGEKVALSESEIEKLFRDNKIAGQLLTNKEALRKEEDDAPQEYILYNTVLS
jgi:ankyrin repeat protein